MLARTDGQLQTLQDLVSTPSAPPRRTAITH
jgi:hypothetical protein